MSSLCSVSAYFFFSENIAWNTFWKWWQKFFLPCQQIFTRFKTSYLLELAVSQPLCSIFFSVAVFSLSLFPPYSSVRVGESCYYASVWSTQMFPVGEWLQCWKLASAAENWPTLSISLPTALVRIVNVATVLIWFIVWYRVKWFHSAACFALHRSQIVVLFSCPERMLLEEWGNGFQFYGSLSLQAGRSSQYGGDWRHLHANRDKLCKWSCLWFDYQVYYWFGAGNNGMPNNLVSFFLCLSLPWCVRCVCLDTCMYFSAG